MKIYLRLEAPYEWVRVDENKSGIANDESRIEAFGEVQSLDDYPVSDDDDVIGVVSGDWITTQRVELPAKTKKMFSAALPYALEESISEDVENMHFVSPDWKAGVPCNVLAISKEKMQQWCTLANEHRLPVTRLIPDHSLVPIHDGADCTVVLDGDHVYARKQGDFGVCVDKDFLDAWLMDVPPEMTIAVNDHALTETLIADNPNRDFRHWEFGSKVVHWLDYENKQNLDLWGDKYRPSVRRSAGNPYFLSLLVLVLVVVGKLGFDAYQFIALRSEINAIKQEQLIAFNAAMPDFGDVAQGQERSVMEHALSRMGQDNDTVNLQSMLATIARVVGGQNVTISELSFQNGELLVSCLLSDFSQVDRLAKQMNASAQLSANLQSSETDDGKVVASYLIKTKKR